MAYRLTRQAADDITHIYIDGVSMFGVIQAEKYHVEMEATFKLIDANPKLARERLEIMPPVRVHPFGSHIIVYIADDKNDVLIVRVRHGQEDWKDHPAR